MNRLHLVAGVFALTLFMSSQPALSLAQDPVRLPTIETKAETSQNHWWGDRSEVCPLFQ